MHHRKVHVNHTHSSLWSYLNLNPPPPSSCPKQKEVRNMISAINPGTQYHKIMAVTKHLIGTTPNNHDDGVHFFFLSLKESRREVTLSGTASFSLAGVTTPDPSLISWSLLARSLFSCRSWSRPVLLPDCFFLCFLSKNLFWWARIGNNSV